MPLKLYYEKRRLNVSLSGEIDHHVAAALREQIDQAIAKHSPTWLVLDFGGVTFMDSSAVGLVMGRYKVLSAMGGTLEVINLSPVAYRMMKMSNLQSLAKLSPKVQEKERSHA